MVMVTAVFEWHRDYNGNRVLHLLSFFDFKSFLDAC
jgi:hypothetical protein